MQLTIIKWLKKLRDAFRKKIIKMKVEKEKFVDILEYHMKNKEK